MNIIRYLGRGVFHEDNGVPCQDRAKYRYAKNGNVILALSDGCSSAKYAEAAADANVDTVLRLFSRLSLREFLRREDRAAGVIDPILAAMKRKYGKRFTETPSDFSATLLFAVTDGEDLLIGHLGDGNALCVREDGSSAFYSPEDNAGSADRTFFTVSPGAKDRLRLTALPMRDVRNVLLYSDGPQKMLWYRGDRDIEKAALELTDKVREGAIADCRTLSDTLAEMTADAMYQLMDDWSVLLLDTRQPQCRDLRLDPVSMKQRFMKTFNERNAGKEGPPCP